MQLRARRLRNTDLFAVVNLALFLGWCAFTERSLAAGYGTVGSVREFLVYACSLIAVIGLSWFFLRRWPCDGRLLLLVEIGLLAHFAGAFVPVDGGRLYEVTLLGLSFDKPVHLLNAFAGAALIDHFLRAAGLRLAALPLVVVGLTIGAGSTVEIIEYLAFVAVPDAGVGGYANNMQDLVSNLIGAILFVTAAAIVRHARRRQS